MGSSLKNSRLATMTNNVLSRMTEALTWEELSSRVNQCEGNPGQIVQLVHPFFQEVDDQGDQSKMNCTVQEKDIRRPDVQFPVDGLQNGTDETEEILPDKVEAEARKKAQMLQFTSDLFSLKSPHPLAPAFEDFVEIKYDRERGRHCVTTKDVPIGTTILVEKPFVFVLENSLKNIGRAKTKAKITETGTSCNNCLKWLPYNQNGSNTIKSCPNCVFADFCSEECEKIAQSTFHKYECPCLFDFYRILDFPADEDDLVQSSKVMNLYLAFKIICTLGPQKLLEIYQSTLNNPDSPYSLNRAKENSSSTTNSDTSSTILGSDPATSIYDPSSYLPIFHLASSKSFKFPQVIPLAVTTLTLTQFLDKNTDFFKDVEENLVEQLKLFASALLLRHFENIQENVYSIIDTIKDEDNIDTISLKVGRGLYPTASLFNHSCDPNVTRFFDTNRQGVMAAVALKTIRKGEELCISYTFPYYQMEQSDRQTILQTTYNFLCGCLACTEYWMVPANFGNSVNLPLPLKSLICSDCSVKYGSSQRTRERMKEIGLRTREKNFNILNCPSCLTNYNRSDLTDLLDKRRKIYKICNNLARTSFPMVALKNLVSIMQFYNEMLCPATLDLNELEDTFKYTIRRTIYYAYNK